eukprot:g67967.t1
MRFCRCDVVDIVRSACYLFPPHRKKAHGGKPVWCMGALPDRSGIVTGGGDKEVKFWEYELTEKTVGEGKSLIKTKLLGLVLAKTLKVTDEVLSVQVSPNGKLVAAG